MLNNVIAQSQSLVRGPHKIMGIRGSPLSRDNHRLILRLADVNHLDHGLLVPIELGSDDEPGEFAGLLIVDLDAAYRG